MINCTIRSARRVCLGLLLLVFSVAGSPAAVRYVATNGGAPNDGNLWSTAFTNLQDALNAAGKDDTIYLAGQTFALTNAIVWVAKTNISILGGYAATNDADTPGPYDPAKWPTVLTRSLAYSNRLMTITNVVTGTLARVTLTGGYHTGGVNLYGGGLYIIGSTGLVLSACVVSSNGMLGSSSSVYGGGIYAKNSVMTLDQCVVRGNYPNTSQNYVYSVGGGIYVDGGRMTIRDSIVANNRVAGSNADFRHGGGLYNAGAVCFMTNCLVTGNGTDGRLGDGVYLNAGTQIMQNCTVAYNAGQGLNRIAGLASVSNSIFWANGDDLVGNNIALAWSDIEDGDSNGVSGCFSAGPLFERGFYLATNSPCVNAGTNDAGVWYFSNLTTRADSSNDSGRVDLGYHYPTGFDLSVAPDLFVSGGGLDSSNGLSWASAYRTVTKALSVARDGTRINVGSGFYTNGVETFPLTVDGRFGLQILGTNCLDTLIDAKGANQRVLTLLNCANVLVSNVTLKGGAQVAAPPNNYGGGISVWSCGGVEFAGCAIRHNRMAPPANYACYGGGIYSRFSVLSLADCLVNSNIAVTSENAAYPRGAGIYMEFGVLTVRDSVISTNRGAGGQGNRYGGGLYNNGAICLLKNCLLTGNTTAPGLGDGIYQATATATLTLDNCTVAYNVGQGINRTAGSVTVSNSIFWGNTVDIAGNVGAVYLYYSDFQSGLSNGVNNCVQFDPLFADTNYFHLQSIQGVYTGGYFSGGGWSTSLANSPAIDAGDTNSAYGREPTPNGSRVNMGYDGNSPTASKTDISSVFDPPVVTNLGATQIGHRTVRLNGEVTDTGGSVPDCTLALWIAGSGVTSSIPLGLKDGVFSNDVINLIPGSNYNFAFSAVNGGGSVWSDVKSFTTHANPFSFYVATNGNDTTGADWATAFRKPQTALSVIEPGDEVYLAGQTFRSDNQLLWTASGSYVRVAGGYAATNAADQPGAFNTTNWPTVLTLQSAVSNRVLFITNVLASTLERVTLTGGCRDQDEFGGGIYVVASTGLVLSACVISSNAVNRPSVAVYGGGLYVKSSGLTLSNCQVRANSATTSGNYPGSYGGGLYVIGGTLTVVNSTLSSNKCFGSNGLGRHGGGLCNEGAVGVLRNSLVFGNSTYGSGMDTWDGDGLYVVAGTQLLENCVVANNAGQGYKRVAGLAAATNSIFWSNGDDLTGTIAVAYCDIQTADAYWTNQVNGCISADPQFVNPSAGNYNLSPGSPCINAGIRQNWMNTAFDIIGNKRVIGVSVDLGAYELPVACGTVFILN